MNMNVRGNLNTPRKRRPLTLDKYGNLIFDKPDHTLSQSEQQVSELDRLFAARKQGTSIKAAAKKAAIVMAETDVFKTNRLRIESSDTFVEGYSDLNESPSRRSSVDSVATDVPEFVPNRASTNGTVPEAEELPSTAVSEDDKVANGRARVDTNVDASKVDPLRAKLGSGQTDGTDAAKRELERTDSALGQGEEARSSIASTASMSSDGSVGENISIDPEEIYNELINQRLTLKDRVVKEGEEVIRNTQEALVIEIKDEFNEKIANDSTKIYHSIIIALKEKISKKNKNYTADELNSHIIYQYQKIVPFFRNKGIELSPEIDVVKYLQPVNSQLNTTRRWGPRKERPYPGASNSGDEKTLPSLEEMNAFINDIAERKKSLLLSKFEAAFKIYQLGESKIAQYFKTPSASKHLMDEGDEMKRQAIDQLKESVKEGFDSAVTSKLKLYLKVTNGNEKYHQATLGFFINKLLAEDGFANLVNKKYGPKVEEKFVKLYKSKQSFRSKQSFLKEYIGPKSEVDIHPQAVYLDSLILSLDQVVRKGDIKKANKITDEVSRVLLKYELSLEPGAQPKLSDLTTVPISGEDLSYRQFFNRALAEMINNSEAMNTRPNRSPFKKSPSNIKWLDESVEINSQLPALRGPMSRSRMLQYAKECERDLDTLKRTKVALPQSENDNIKIENEIARVESELGNVNNRLNQHIHTNVAGIKDAKVADEILWCADAKNIMTAIISKVSFSSKAAEFSEIQAELKKLKSADSHHWYNAKTIKLLNELAAITEEKGSTEVDLTELKLRSKPIIAKLDKILEQGISQHGKGTFSINLDASIQKAGKMVLFDSEQKIGAKALSDLREKAGIASGEQSILQKSRLNFTKMLENLGHQMDSMAQSIDSLRQQFSSVKSMMSRGSDAGVEMKDISPDPAAAPTPKSAKGPTK